MNRVVLAGCVVAALLLAGCKCGCLMGTTPADDSSQVSQISDEANIQSSKG